MTAYHALAWDDDRTGLWFEDLEEAKAYVRELYHRGYSNLRIYCAVDDDSEEGIFFYGQDGPEERPLEEALGEV